MTTTQLKWGIIGHNIQYSLSPLIHNSFAKIHGISAEYKIYDIPAKQFTQKIFSLQNKDIIGFNLTTPHKIKVLDFFPNTNCNSVNTIYKQNKSIQYNELYQCNFKRSNLPNIG